MTKQQLPMQPGQASIRFKLGITEGVMHAPGKCLKRPLHPPSATELTQVYGSNQTTKGEGCDWLSLLKKEFPKSLADLVYRHLNVEQ